MATMILNSDQKRQADDDKIILEVVKKFILNNANFKNFYKWHPNEQWCERGILPGKKTYEKSNYNSEVKHSGEVWFWRFKNLLLNHILEAF